MSGEIIDIVETGKVAAPVTRIIRGKHSFVWRGGHMNTDAASTKDRLVDFEIAANGHVREIHRAKTHSVAANEMLLGFATDARRNMIEIHSNLSALHKDHINSDTDSVNSVQKVFVASEPEANGSSQRTPRKRANGLIDVEIDANGLVRDLRRRQTAAPLDFESSVERDVLVAAQHAIETAVRQSSYSIVALRQSLQTWDDSFLIICLILVFMLLLAVYFFWRRFLFVCISKRFKLRNSPIARASLHSHREDNEHPSWKLYMDHSQEQGIDTPSMKEQWFEMMIDLDFANQVDALLDVVQNEKAGMSAVSQQGALFSWEDVQQVWLSLEEEIHLCFVGRGTRKIICKSEVIADDLGWLAHSWEDSFPSQRPLDRAAFQDLCRLLITHNHYRNVIYALVSSFVLPFYANLESTSGSSLADLGIDSFATTVRARLGQETLILLQIQWEGSDVDQKFGDDYSAQPRRMKSRQSQASSFCPTSSDESTGRPTS